MSDVALRCTLAGVSQEIFVSSGWLRQRQRGNWTSYLVCSSPVAPAGSAATVVFRREDGTEDTFAGTVRRAVSNPGSRRLVVTVVGGAGKLINTVRPVDHVLGTAEVRAGTIARAICDDAGEVLDPDAEAFLDGLTLARWHRSTDVTAATALDLLAYELGLVWRVTPAGVVWMGAETWPAVNGAAYWMDLDEDDGGALYAVRGAPLLVGQTIDGVQAVDVRYAFGEDSLTAEIRGAVAGDPPHVPDLDLYRGTYSATIVAQNDDETIDVRADDPRIGDLRSLRLRVGIPGALVTVDPETDPPPRCRVAFDGASPAGAYATALDQDPAGAHAVALVDLSGVTIGTLSADAPPGGGPVTFTWQAPGPGLPIVAESVTLTGTVTGPGSARVKLR